MALLGMAGVTVASMLVLTKAYGTDLAPFIAKMWAVYALWEFGLRLAGVVSFVQGIASFIGGLP